MTSSLDRVLTDRFARLHEELPQADFADVRRRARRLFHRATATVGRRRLTWLGAALFGRPALVPGLDRRCRHRVRHCVQRSVRHGAPTAACAWRETP